MSRMHNNMLASPNDSRQASEPACLRREETLVILPLGLQAYVKLIRFDFYLARKNFSALYSKVRSYPLGKNQASPNITERVCHAVDMACIWYWKEVLCLQRSAVATCLLKKYGVPAQMVIGAQQMPFKAHAWVEVDGRVVNDKSYTPGMYAVLDRC